MGGWADKKVVHSSLFIVRRKNNGNDSQLGDFGQ